MQTYKSKTFLEALLPTMKMLQKKHQNPVNFLKAVWVEIAPSWAILAQPYMIRKNTLIMQTDQAHAITLQYREQELLSIIQAVLGTSSDGVVIERIKIITKS